MICTTGFGFMEEFLHEVHSELCNISQSNALSNLQRKWLKFCITGILVTGSLCWSQFERFSLGQYTMAGLSWMMRRAKIVWFYLFIASIRVILKKYSVRMGHLVLDDTDRQRSKSTKTIAGVHKIFDKKTGGYFMGQNLVFLLLVTDKITLPVGFKFYVPDPKRVAWNKEDKRLRGLKIPKSQRPPPPELDPKYPSKIELGLSLIREFKQHFSDVDIRSLSADAAYGSADFFHEANQIYPTTQVISQLRSNQKVWYRNTSQCLLFLRV